MPFLATSNEFKVLSIQRKKRSKIRLQVRRSSSGGRVGGAGDRPAQRGGPAELPPIVGDSRGRSIY
jgi:hypothetical protein